MKIKRYIICLYTKWRVSREAKKDIHCFKVLKRNKKSKIFWAPVFKKMYKQDKEYETIIVKYGKRVSKGFHSCLTMEIAIVRGTRYASKETSKNYDICILDAIIPAGSLYYINSNNDEIVSNRIIVKDVLKQTHLCNIFF